MRDRKWRVVARSVVTGVLIGACGGTDIVCGCQGDTIPPVTLFPTKLLIPRNITNENG
jgi:hypothetical protein